MTRRDETLTAAFTAAVTAIEADQLGFLSEFLSEVGLWGRHVYFESAVEAAIPRHLNEVLIVVAAQLSALQGRRAGYPAAALVTRLFEEFERSGMERQLAWLIDRAVTAMER